MHAALEDTNVLTPPRNIILTLTKAEACQLHELMGWDSSIPALLRGMRSERSAQPMEDGAFMSAIHRALTLALREHR